MNYPPPHSWGPPARTSGLAVAAFLLGLTSLLMPCLAGLPGLVGIALGHSARGQIKRGHRGGNGIAVAALILSYMSLVWLALVVAAQ
ncbi:protein of unknown function [Sinosporangium album]|uniref:DUF4190 domain-containing protein n=1 Tax=Sinosporangium album TaxID=504805 RepID=A0A1G8AB43_9ACTN|nr:DUF4190 domain-containing protein [Sinosporangium album]SDH18255.1 protein of unknown function [Sinosporangium album]